MVLVRPALQKECKLKKNMANKSGSKPIVNWMKRKKEVSYSDSTDAKGQNYKIKTKVVTAPASRTSKPMEKKVVKVTKTESRKDKNLGKRLGAMLGGAGLGMSASQNYEKKRSEKSLNNLNINPPKGLTQKQIDRNKADYKADISDRAKSAKNLLIGGIAAPLVGAAVDKMRGKTKKVVVSRTKTKNK
jgi:hypothetical protein